MVFQGFPLISASPIISSISFSFLLSSPFEPVSLVFSILCSSFLFIFSSFELIPSQPEQELLIHFLSNFHLNLCYYLPLNLQLLRHHHNHRRLNFHHHLRHHLNHYSLKSSHPKRMTLKNQLHLISTLSNMNWRQRVKRQTLLQMQSDENKLIKSSSESGDSLLPDQKQHLHQLQIMHQTTIYLQIHFSYSILYLEHSMISYHCNRFMI